ncbi:hypothetical protein [Thalassomonas sp. RHCl1]|uniref:hypothetical protein n=1 Tax=Thalassomonas sp. RHCl1 TaxID=2995320 RepID=UPI00248AC382|nr:hypothetical protein [Thalassomonas sp. RHCl1]
MIWRLGHSYTKFDGDYRDEAAATVNLSGNRIYWTSNWGGNLDHREAFIMELPDDCDNKVLE